mgnify:CR=1 FL=1
MKHNVTYACAKCGNSSYEEGSIRVTGGSILTKLFNVQNRRFTYVSCEQCGYTEFYKGQNSGVASNLIDFISN